MGRVVIKIVCVLTAILTTIVLHYHQPVVVSIGLTQCMLALGGTIQLTQNCNSKK